MPALHRHTKSEKERIAELIGWRINLGIAGCVTKSGISSPTSDGAISSCGSNSRSRRRQTSIAYCVGAYRPRRRSRAHLGVGPRDKQPKLTRCGSLNARPKSVPPFWGIVLGTNYRLILEREDGGPGGDGSAGALIAKAARGIASWGCLGHKSGARRKHLSAGPCVANASGHSSTVFAGLRAASNLQSMCWIFPIPGRTTQ